MDSASTPPPAPRASRKVLVGVVSSRMGRLSIKVTIPYKRPHPLYRKVVNRKTVVHAHDAKDECRLGDKVEIMETRPISKLKRWRVTRVVEKAPEAHRFVDETLVPAPAPSKP